MVTDLVFTQYDQTHYIDKSIGMLDHYTKRDLNDIAILEVVAPL